MPSGSAYDLEAYGRMKDFQVAALK